jgi:hypothetical protein
MPDSEKMKAAIHEVANNIVEGLEDTARAWYTNEIDDYEVIKRYGNKVDAGILAPIDPYKAIQAERARQDKKWGSQNHDDLYWLGILMEEVGEVAQHVIEGRDPYNNHELVEVAAVAVAWLEAINRRI